MHVLRRGQDLPHEPLDLGRGELSLELVEVSSVAEFKGEVHVDATALKFSVNKRESPCTNRAQVAGYSRTLHDNATDREAVYWLPI
jgi:hypothetical protein